MIANLRRDFRVEYRVAYMVGVNWFNKDKFGVPNCYWHSGDAVLYNSARIRNMNPQDLAGQQPVAHDAQLEGVQVRRSLPLCNRGTVKEPMEDLIDGPLAAEKCQTPTPTGPARAIVVRAKEGEWRLGASLARLALRRDQGASFDLITVHPGSGDEAAHGPLIDDFVQQAIATPQRTSGPRYPTIVLGDLNGVPADWPTGMFTVWSEGPYDVMGVRLAQDGVGLAPQYHLYANFMTRLPWATPIGTDRCGNDPDSFSDHCGGLVTFGEGP